MKKFLTFVILAIIMPIMVMAQNNLSYSGAMDPFFLEDSDRTANYLVLGGINSTDAAHTNITYINNVRYENLLLASSNSSSFPSGVREVKICGNQLLIAGSAVGVGGTMEATVALYNLPSVSLEGYIRISQLDAGSMATNLVKDGNTIYFQVTGMNANSNYRSSFGNLPVTFASPTEGINLNPTASAGIFKFNFVNNSLDQVKYVSETERIAYKSKSLVKSGNYFFYAQTDLSNGTIVIVKKDSNLNTVGTCPLSLSNNGTYFETRLYDILVSQENGTEYLYVYVQDYNNASKGLRKINTGTMAEDLNFNASSSYYSIMSPVARKLIKTSDRISILYTNYGYGEAVVDVAFNGDVISYKKLAANNSDMSPRSGVTTLAGYYDNSLNKIIFSGLVGKTATEGSVPFYGQELPVGTRIATYEYTPVINPMSDMTMTIPAYPSATIERVLNSFYVTGIPASAYASVTLATSFLNSGTLFVASPGNGGSLTKNFTDATVDNFGSHRTYGSNFSYTWESTAFAVRMGSALSNDDFDLTKKEKLYPNPTSGTLYVSESIVSNFDLVEIFDISGRLISSSKLESEISLNDQRPGMFFVRLINSETGVSKVEKIIKK
jgi:hypothetical protein